MKKKLLARAALGAPLGIAISYLITIAISAVMGWGVYSPCVPSLVDSVGTEVGAVAVQAGLSALLGAAFGAASLIWKMERWSIAKQTGLYFLVSSLAMMPVAYCAHWMERTLGGILSYFGIFLAIFVLVWIIQYLFWRNRVRLLNKRVEENKED